MKKQRPLYLAKSLGQLSHKIKKEVWFRAVVKYGKFDEAKTAADAAAFAAGLEMIGEE